MDVGVVGVKYLLPTISDAGRGDAGRGIPPSYIYMVEQGATTLWQQWTGSKRERCRWYSITFLIDVEQLTQACFKA